LHFSSLILHGVIPFPPWESGSQMSLKWDNKM
jgi:hypothetical protein